ncbi:MAG: DUF3685 domain-containing protein [Snowella sp.]|nr:DUF3685 domain-containing protein [Snowella sp.]
MSDRPIRLILIDEDPIFRLGLVTALISANHFQVLAQVESPQSAIAALNQSQPDIVILDPLSLENANQGWELCRRIQQNYPAVKICLLTATLEYSKLIQAKKQGVEAYFPKGTPLNQLLEGLQQIADNQICWSDLSFFRSYIKLNRQNRWLLNSFQSGLSQIENSLNNLSGQLQNPRLSAFDELFLEGQKRELLTARWLVKRLMPKKLKMMSQLLAEENPSANLSNSVNLPVVSPAADLISVDVPTGISSTSNIFATTLIKLQASVSNLTDVPLELDILKIDRKQELLILVLNQFQHLLNELKTLEVTREQLPEDTSLILVEIWQSVTLTFFGKYCSPKDNFKIDKIQDFLNSYRNLIQAESLSKIPFTKELLSYFLFAENLVVDEVSYRSESPEAGERAEIYLQNLIIQVANSVMVFILNYFSENEEIKQALYQEKMLSSREIAKFRNDLAWRYQLSKYWLEPENIFESQYSLFYFTLQGIKLTQVYFPRQAELTRLEGLPLATTIILELRDALSPRLRSLVTFTGNGLVFVLTQVIGRAIGLVVRGILQGVGTTWQETRYSRKRSRENSNF